MKNILVSVMLLASLPHGVAIKGDRNPAAPSSSANIFIITIDGFRWQEIFHGADSILINDPSYTPDNETLKAMYWAGSEQERRERLMPFFWKVLATKGQLFGNRTFDNKVNVANAYAISYPGYNEIFTGTTDGFISSNRRYDNPNINVLEYLDKKEAFHGKVAAFTSWDVFPYILNEKRNGLPVNSGYKTSTLQTMTDRVAQEGVYEKQATRYDELTYITASEYVRHQQPRVLYLGFGETDEFAHQGRYDLYLQQANKTDQMIAGLWHWVQTTPGYEDNTTFIITTDHGRGSKSNKWASHGAWITGSSQTWLAVIGPGIASLGEIKDNQQLYQAQLAQTIAAILGEKFEPGIAVAKAIGFSREEMVHTK